MVKVYHEGCLIWWFPEIGVPPVIHVRLGFSLINQAFWGTSMTMEPSILTPVVNDPNGCRLREVLPDDDERP